MSEAPRAAVNLVPEGPSVHASEIEGLANDLVALVEEFEELL